MGSPVSAAVADLLLTWRCLQNKATAIYTPSRAHALTSVNIFIY